jgi:carbon storage regulator
LVLSRRPGESIFIGENIYVTLIEIGRGQARLGITCPADVKIYRQEIAPNQIRATPKQPKKGDK